MKPDVSQKYNINTISDLKDYTNELVFSPTLEFENREDRASGLNSHYNMEFKNIKAMDGSIRYSALEKNESQVIDAFATDGLIKKFGLKVLEDDKNFFVPYYAVPLVSSDILDKYSGLEDLFNMLSGKIDGPTMAELNYQVDELGKTPEAVANEFLSNSNLIK